MNEEINRVSSEEMSDAETDYVAAINELKSNSVSKEQYNKLREENKKLLDSLVNNTPLETSVVKEKPNVEELRQKLFGKELSNLEYASTALQLREALLEDGQPDPFIATGSQILPTKEDMDAANRVAEVLQSCVDYADGNSEIFTNELQRVTVDVSTRPNRRY